jgi:ABC-2 type transport system permease protein
MTIGSPRTRRFLSLVKVLSQKNFQIRYRRTALGIVWALLQPVIQAVVVAVVFLKIFKGFAVPKYPLFVLSGVMPWALTTRSLGVATSAVVDNASLVKKVAVSRLIYPLAAIGGTLVVYLASLVVVICGGLIYRTLDVRVLFLPLAVLLQLLVTTGPSILGAAYYVSFRDVRYLVESGLIILFYATPVIYPSDRLGPTGVAVQRWNPMTGVLSLYRAAVLPRPVDWAAVAISFGFGVIVLALGLVAFHRRSAEFADLS